MDVAGRPWRLFIALPLPVEVAAAVVERLAATRARHRDARWLPAQSLHLTLLFLGSTDPGHVDGLRAAVDEAAARQAAFTVALGPGAGRARRGHGVAWLSLAQGGRDTTELADRLAELVRPMGVGDARGPRRAPSAHLTVARNATPDLLADSLFAEAPHPPVTWRADRIVLFRSHLRPGGSVYEALHEATLAASS